jgi:hypothetical protein
MRQVHKGYFMTSSKTAKLFVGAILLWSSAQVVMGEMRTWTSASGSTVEAELVRVDGSLVILRNPDGKPIRIPGNKLSAADQAFIKEQLSQKSAAQALAASTPAGQAAPAKNPGDPHAAKPKAGKADPIFGAYENVSAIKMADLPNCDFTDSYDAKSIGVQYGPSSTEVIYIALNQANMEEAPDSLYVYSPALPAYNQGKVLKGKSKKVMDNKAFLFPPIPLKSTFPDVKANIELEIVSGAKSWYFVLGRATIQLTRNRDNCTFMLGEFLNAHLSTSSDPIQVVPLLKTPTLKVTESKKGFTHSAEIHLTVGSFLIFPDKNMSDEIEFEIETAEGESAFEKEFEVSEDLLETSGGSHKKPTYNVSIKDLEEGVKHTATAFIDLGPIFGELEVKQDLK